MLEQINNNLRFYAHYIENKISKTGLTVTVSVYRNGIAIIVDAAASEIGDGLYSYTLDVSYVNIEGEYIAVFKTATTSVSQQHITDTWYIQKAGIEKLDSIKAKTDLITSSNQISVIASIAADQTITTIRGDSYLFDDDRQIAFTFTGIPDITDGTVRLIVSFNGTIFSKEGVITAADECYIELTSEETEDFRIGSFRYNLEVTLDSGSIFTPLLGTFIVQPDIR